MSNCSSDLRERLPRSHVEFLQSLELSYETGDYLFVHAGVRSGPSRSISRPPTICCGSASRS